MTALQTGLLAAAVLAYLVGTWLALWGVRRPGPVLLLLARAWAVLGAAIHVAFLAVLAAHTRRFPVTRVLEAFVFLSTAMIAAALVIDARRKVTILVIATLPMALATGLLGLALHFVPELSAGAGRGLGSVWTVFHVVGALASYGAFALAFVSGILYVVAHRQLKGHAVSPVLGLMPALETVERLNVRSMAVGVVLLLAGLLVGYLHARNVYAGERGWRVDPKIILTTLTVVVYSGVLALSARPAFRGRRTALASVASFVLIPATFWASVFWSGFHRFH